MATRIVDVLVPVALDQTYSYRVPAGTRACARRSGRGAARRARRDAWAWSGPTTPTPNPRLHNRMKDVTAKLDVPPLKAELRNFVDWVADYTLAPRGMVLRMALRMGEHLGPGARARRRAARRAAAAAHDAGARARAAPVRRRADARQGRRRARSRRLSAGVIDGLIDEGALETLVLPPEPVALPPDPDFRKPDFVADAACRGGCAAHHRRSGRRYGDAARRRHRLGQDRSLFRGGGGKYPQGAADADPDAGDRAHRAVARPLHRALRRAAGGMALASFAAQARAHLGGGGGERGLGRGRRALGAVSALCRSRPHHRR